MLSGLQRLGKHVDGSRVRIPLPANEEMPSAMTSTDRSVTSTKPLKNWLLNPFSVAKNKRNSPSVDPQNQPLLLRFFDVGPILLPFTYTGNTVDCDNLLRPRFCIRPDFFDFRSTLSLAPSISMAVAIVSEP